MAVRVGARGSRFSLVVPADTPHLAQWVLDVYERSVLTQLRREISPGATVVDIGAHVGYFAIQAAKLVGDSGKVIAVEPFPMNADFLRKSAAANKISLEIVQFAAGASIEKQGFWFPDFEGTPVVGHLSTNPTESEITVEVRTLDSILQRLGASRVDLVKVDVEGSELDVLAGAVTTMTTHQPNFIVEIQKAEIPALSRLCEERSYTNHSLGRRGSQAFLILRPEVKQ